MRQLLPRAMDFRNGDVKVIKNAGAIVSHPFGSVMRSILVAVYELTVAEVAVDWLSAAARQGIHFVSQQWSELQAR